MTISRVRRPNSILEATSTMNVGWQDDMLGWMKQDGLTEDEINQSMTQIIAYVEAAEVKPWFLHSATGVEVVHPADFVDFEDVAATDVLEELWVERRRQGSKGYTYVHDDVHGIGHLVTEAVGRISNLNDKEDSEVRSRLIKSAALLVAAVDLLDRKESKERKFPQFHDAEDVTQISMGVDGKWIERVVEYSEALDDLAGQAQDEIDTSTPEDAIGWARTQFEQIFKIKEKS